MTGIIWEVSHHLCFLSFFAWTKPVQSVTNLLIGGQKIEQNPEWLGNIWAKEDTFGTSTSKIKLAQNRNDFQQVFKNKAFLQEHLFRNNSTVRTQSRVHHCAFYDCRQAFLQINIITAWISSFPSFCKNFVLFLWKEIHDFLSSFSYSNVAGDCIIWAAEISALGDTTIPERKPPSPKDIMVFL